MSVEKQPEALEADVVIIGAGVAGGMAAWKLARRGVKVLILEAGPETSRSEIYENFLGSHKFDPVSIYPNTELAPRPEVDKPDSYLINEGTFQYKPQYIRAVGGTTWHWTAYVSRFRPEDFQLQSRYGVGVDWPIGYDDLEPYYCEAEREMGVAASLSGQMEGIPYRSQHPPLAPFIQPYLFRRLVDLLKSYDYTPYYGEVARNSQHYDGRPACQGNNNCMPICPIGAQYAGVVHVDKAREAGARLIAEALVTGLEADAKGRIAGVRFKRPDGTEAVARGKAVIVAANGIETPKLLLASADEAHPAGIANSSDQVGRNYMDHTGVASQVVMDEPVYTGRGPVNGLSFLDYSGGGVRGHRAAAGLGISNKLSLHPIAEKALRSGLSGEALDNAVREQAARSFNMVSFVEQLPNPERRITLDWDQRDSAGQPRVRINYFIDDYSQTSMDYMKNVHAQIAEHLKARSIQVWEAPFTANHLEGAAGMGADNRKSVVDAQCRSHDHPNLYIAGSAVFPTSGAQQTPTLTIAALSLRLAETVQADLAAL